jgi:Domain of unknown function (DUF4383)
MTADRTSDPAPPPHEPIREDDTRDYRDDRTDDLTAAHRAGVREGVARTIAQSFCLALGLVLIAVGILGFLFGGDGFDTGAGVSGDEFLGLEVNGWHNVVHIASGAFLVLVAGSARTAALGSLIFGLVYAAVCVLGFVDGSDVFDVVAINDADNWLHLGLAVVAIIVGIMSGALGASARRERRRLGVDR